MSPGARSGAARGPTCSFSSRFSEEIPNEENEINNESLSKSGAEAKAEGSPPLLHKKVVASSALAGLAHHHAPLPVSRNSNSVPVPPLAQPPGTRLPPPQFEAFADFLPDGELLSVPLVVEDKSGEGPAAPPPLDFNDNEDIPTELSDSSETHDEGTEMRE